MSRIPISVLELAVVIDGGNHQLAIKNTVKVAQHIESLGYTRIWMAEHHNMKNIASSATSVLIGHVAGKTKKLRVGSGGIMLPNHSPLVIAEHFGTLETIYPGRIDLGLGRAPGSDQETARALRGNNMNAAQNFKQDIRQLQQYFSAENSGAKVRAFPGEGLTVPLYVLGSSTDSAYLAAELGLPYAFASHFAPAQFRQAISVYRSRFKPSASLEKPYVMACVNVLAADTDEEASVLLNSLISLIVGIITNTRKPLQILKETPKEYQIPEVKQAVDNMLACTFVGDKDSIKRQVSSFIEETQIDELIVTSHIFDLEAKLKSFSILKEALN